MNTNSAKIITIANEKGGVGKTTTAINLSQALALLDNKILLIDLDSQGNATGTFGVDNNNTNIKYSVLNALRDKTFDINKTILKSDGIDINPSSKALHSFEKEMISITNSEFRLKRALETIKNNYDYIIIDTHPSLGPLLNSAMNASGFLIIPVDSSPYSLEGVRMLLSEYAEIREETNKEIDILGVLVTRFEKTNASKSAETILKQSFGAKVFATKIRKSTKLVEAPVFKRTIFHHAPSDKGASDYLRLAKEVKERCELPTRLTLIEGMGVSI